MSKRKLISAGLLLYRQTEEGLECFIAHPGGPFWRNRNRGAWTIPKGIVEPDEELLEAAVREFTEETGIEPQEPFHSLASVRLKSGKTIHAWAWEGNADAAHIRSNEARMEWPRNSGRWIDYPEIDRCGWFQPAEAKALMNPSQSAFVDRLVALRQNDTATAAPSR